jgi:hypothetical protein
MLITSVAVRILSGLRSQVLQTKIPRIALPACQDRMMDDGDNPKVVRLPRKVDTSGKPLRREGPCYICGQSTTYRFSGVHSHYGDVWIDKQFSPAVYASNVEALRSGFFLRQRFQGGNTLRQLLKFVCPPCLDEMKDRLWPEAAARERGEAERRYAAARDIEAQRQRASPNYDVRLVSVNDREIEIRLGDVVIGGIEYDARTSRLLVLLGDAYLGSELPLMWTGGPAAVEIDLRGGIDES